MEENPNVIEGDRRHCHGCKAEIFWAVEHICPVLTKLQADLAAALLQNREANLELNRYKMILKLVVEAWGDERDCSTNPGHPGMAERVRIARALLYGPEIDPSLME